jgi:hypothetical protein
LLELLIGIVLVDLPAQCEQINQRLYASNASRKDPNYSCAYLAEIEPVKTEHTEKADNQRRYATALDFIRLSFYHAY